MNIETKINANKKKKKFFTPPKKSLTYQIPDANSVKSIGITLSLPKLRLNTLNNVPPFFFLPINLLQHQSAFIKKTI